MALAAFAVQHVIWLCLHSRVKIQCSVAKTGVLEHRHVFPAEMSGLIVFDVGYAPLVRYETLFNSVVNCYRKECENARRGRALRLI
jgi:hypothetical protein